MPLIGHKKYAEHLANFPWPVTIYEKRDPDTWERIPDTMGNVQNNYKISPGEGWKFLGEGCSRAVFLGPDGVAYKVLKEGEDPDSDVHSNKAEAHVWRKHGRRVRRSGKVRLAPLRYFRHVDVIAMEYCERIQDSDRDAVAWLDANGFGGDLHPGNIWQDSKGAVMVDYGYVKDNALRH